MPPVQVIAQRLYRSLLLVLLVGGALVVLLSGVPALHDYLVVKADSDCLAQWQDSAAGPDEIPWTKAPTLEVLERCHLARWASASSAFDERGDLVKPSVVKDLYSTRAWSSGSLITYRSSLFTAGSSLLAMLPAALLLLLRMWTNWLTRPETPVRSPE